MSHLLSLATPSLTLKSHEPSDHRSRDGGYAWAKQHRLPLMKADGMTLGL